MKKSEAEYKRRLVQLIQDYGGYGRRIEDQYLVGTPDLILATPGNGLVIAEVKRFGGALFYPSPRQFVEMKRIEEGGGQVALIGISVPDELVYIAPLLIPTKGKVNIKEVNCHSGELSQFPYILDEYLEQTYA